MRIETVVLWFCMTSVLCVAHSQDCNPLVCFYWFSVLFDSKSYVETCSKLKKVEDCLNSCSFPLNEESRKIFKNGMPNLKEAVCNNALEGTEEMSNCYSENKFRLMSCVHSALSTKPLNSSASASHLTCKIMSDVEGCPSEILQSCSDAAITKTSRLMITFVEPVRKDACTNLSVADMWYLPVHEKGTQIKRYQRLAKCMDLNHEAISACLPQKLTVNFLVTRHSKTEICDGFQFFTTCAADIISSRCDEQSADVLMELLSFLRTSLLQFCIDMKELGTTVTTSSVVPTTVHAVKSHSTALEQQESSSDTEAGLLFKSSSSQPQNHSNSNHSVSDILYIIHLSPRIRNERSGVAILSNKSLIHFVILLTLIHLVIV